MKRIIELKCEGNQFIDCVVRFDTGDTMNVTMSRNEYKAQKVREKIYDSIYSGRKSNGIYAENIMKDIEEIEQLSYERGHDDGYDSGYDYGQEY